MGGVQFHITEHVIGVCVAIITASANSPLSDGQAAIDAATRQNKHIFVAYLVVIGLSVLLTYLLWHSGNKVQDAIIADANARIAEADTKADSAKAHTDDVETFNLNLQKEVNTQKERVAVLDKIAADAQRAADTERIARLKLENTISPRIIDHSNAATLAAFRGTRYAILTINERDRETQRFVGQIRSLLSDKAHWIEDESLITLSRGDISGEGVTVEYNSRLGVVEGHTRPEESTDEAGLALCEMFQRNKMQPLQLPRGLSDTMPPLPGHTIIIHVGLKPMGNYYFR